MPKVKIPRKSTSIDMTAMCDVAFLLLTFFMLTTKFKPDEVVVVDTPSSISEIKLPETDILQILIDEDNRVFFGIDGQDTRKEMLRRVAERRNLSFSPAEIEQFALVSNIGVPISQLRSYLAVEPSSRKDFPQSGVPIDSLNNELGDWVMAARQSNPGFRIAIKGDQDSKYPTVKRVFDILQEKQVNKFNFITSMEQNPNDK